MPRGPAELAVGGGAQPDVTLQPDDVGDRLVLGTAQLGVVDLPGGVAGAGLEQRRGTQQAADVVGAERRAGGIGHAREPRADRLRTRVGGGPPERAAADVRGCGSAQATAVIRSSAGAGTGELAPR
ncbi:hypothetical protein GCM10027451_10030 [Geodermatophilus aquaeductus]